MSGITDDDIANAKNNLQSLSLFDAFALTVYNTEDLKIGSESYFQAIEKKRQAFGNFLPYLSFQGNYVLPTSIKGSAPASSSGTSTGISLYGRQNIMTGLSEWGDYSLAGKDMELSKMQLSAMTSSLLFDVSTAYYSILSLQDLYKTNNEILSLYKQTRAEIARRTAIGRSKPSDLSRIDTQIYQLEAQIKDIETNLNSSKLSLSVLTGIDSFLLKDTFAFSEIPDVMEKADELLLVRPDVKFASIMLEKADISHSAAMGGHLPNIYAQGAYSIYSRGPGNDYYIGLGAELPIFEGGSTQAKIREADSQKKAAELNLTKVKKDAKQDIIDSAMLVNSSKSQYDAYQKAYDSAQKTYKAVMADYAKDRVTILDVLSSLTSLQSAKNDFERISLTRKLYRIKLGIAYMNIPAKI
ncbi:MAG: TolC family protein [Leptospirales bacterium]|nr:TolC family protein [Leptospirales bacterium]